MSATLFTPDEVHFLKSLLLDAQFKAEQVPHGPWKAAITNNPRRIAELWDKFHRMEQEQFQRKEH